MGQKIVVGPLKKGLRNDVQAFNIDNDAFPNLRNAYQWRSRVKRKRGTIQLGRLTNYFDNTEAAFNPSASQFPIDGDGNGNLITGFSGSPIPASSSLVPGTIEITVGANTYEDTDSDGILYSGGMDSGSVNYATGAVNFDSESSTNGDAIFKYYPNLPAMGLPDFVTVSTAYPSKLGFNTKFSYFISRTYPYAIHNVSFYKNPPASASLPNYVAKTAWTPVSWNGEDYQLFSTANFQGALWATNGIEVPFETTNIGMQFKPIVSTTIVAGGPPAQVTLQITGHGLVVGDFVFVNEVLSTTGINFQTGYVITVTDANNVVVEFPISTIATNGTGGIAQYLTSQADSTKDCLRYYDGAPVNNASPPVFTNGVGWVNFCPPLVSGPNTTFYLADLAPAQYYLVGARHIVPFKDRLLFIAPVVQSATTGPFFLQDTVIYSQNGSVFYTASFANTDVTPSISDLITASYLTMLAPTAQTSTPYSFFADVNGFGGFIQAGYEQAISTVSANEDVLLLSFETLKSRFVYTGNDIVPFNFYIINSEYGSNSPLSSINLDKGAVDFGTRGITLTTQTLSQRIDLDIPDEVFQVNLSTNGAQRVCVQRDFINEWIYLTYPSANTALLASTTIFPNQTLFYNYRDNSWAIFRESYTCYGQFRRRTGLTWDDLTDFTWDEWTDPWDSGEETLLQPEVIAGTSQGFIMFRAEGTGEDESMYISNISGGVVTSPNHGMDQGDYFIITGALGTIGEQVNGNIYSVAILNTDGQSFSTNPSIPAGTYFGGGVITRMYVPFIQSKQFPVSWEMGRKTRIGVQQYLLTKTPSSQITLLIFLSQNENNAYNIGPIVPANIPDNNSLVYSTLLYTCPESTNLGLTPANINLQMLTGNEQAQIWHRINTSLIGDTVQVGFTLNDEQMRDTNKLYQFDEIELHSIILDVSPSQMLA